MGQLAVRFLVLKWLRSMQGNAGRIALIPVSLMPPENADAVLCDRHSFDETNGELRLNS